MIPMTVLSRDGRPLEVAQQKCPNASVGHHGYRASAMGGVRNIFECPHETGLCGDGALPVADALAWSGKECLDGRLKLRSGEVPGR